jgi:hypothetical protein
MTTLATFSNVRYNKQPHIDDAQNLELEPYTEIAKQIIFKHFMTELVGLFRVHKHMDLAINEQSW